MKHGWYLVAKRRGWHFAVYEYGRNGRIRTGWRPTKRWARAAMARADRRLGGPFREATA